MRSEEEAEEAKEEEEEFQLRRGACPQQPPRLEGHERAGDAVDAGLGSPLGGGGPGGRVHEPEALQEPEPLAVRQVEIESKVEKRFIILQLYRL